MTGKYAVPDGKGGYTVMLEGNFWPGIPSNTSGGNWYAEYHELDTIKGVLLVAFATKEFEQQTTATVNYFTMASETMNS